MHGYSDSFPQNRSDQQCQYRWLRVLNPDLVKGPWTKEEDQKVSPGRTGSELGPSVERAEVSDPQVFLENSGRFFQWWYPQEQYSELF